VVVKTYNPYTANPVTAVMAKSRLNAYLKAEGAELALADYKAGDKVIPYEIIAEVKGTDLVGMHYKQLMPWVKPLEKMGHLAADFVNEYAQAHPEKVFAVGADQFVELSELAFRVIAGDYVTTDDGTGIVHIAPTFGADDAKMARDAQIPSLFMINTKGETRPMVDLTGKYYVEAELAPEFKAACLDASYAHHAGDYVKNAYAPEFNVGGKYDAAAAEKAEDLNIEGLDLDAETLNELLTIEKAHWEEETAGIDEFYAKFDRLPEELKSQLAALKERIAAL
jgi:isoleucyl-tRNA synthetase